MTAKEPKQGTIISYDGDIYPTIPIGTKKWMTSNLKTTKFNDEIDEFSPEQLDIDKKLAELNLKNKLQKIESKRKTKK
jgi:hypothetical protein